jgi:hypothetical protein
MKMYKILFLAVCLVGLCGCSSTKTYTMNENEYNDINDYVTTFGPKYLEYVKNDQTLSKRDKYSMETRYTYIKDILVKIHGK